MEMFCTITRWPYSVTNLQILTTVFNQFHKETRFEQFRGTCTHSSLNSTITNKFCTTWQKCWGSGFLQFCRVKRCIQISARAEGNPAPHRPMWPLPDSRYLCTGGLTSRTHTTGSQLQHEQLLAWWYLGDSKKRERGRRDLQRTNVCWGVTKRWHQA